MNDYQRVARIIDFLVEQHPRQPALEELATTFGMSRFQLHRLFLRWAGVTPKEFLQCLTLQHARRLLEAGESVLDAALGAGLSGPGRLHDLTVRLEAASPGELKSGGSGWQVEFGVAASPFGPCRVARGPRGICELGFPQDLDPERARRAVAASWPGATLRSRPPVAEELVAQVFRRSPDRSLTLRACVAGTPFQVRVWRALLRIPAGAAVSYGAVARLAGRPRAVRAAARAIGQNSLAVLIPCHRVIRQSGAIGDYRWGTSRKQALLAWESSACAEIRSV